MPKSTRSKILINTLVKSMHYTFKYFKELGKYLVHWKETIILTPMEVRTTGNLRTEVTPIKHVRIIYSSRQNIK